MVYVILFVIGAAWLFYYQRKKAKAAAIAQAKAESEYRAAKQQEFSVMNIEFQNLLKTVLSDAVILDTETTGLTNKSEIVEISIIDTQGNVLLDTLVKPKTRMRDDSKAASIHGITNAMLKDAPTWADIHDQVCEILKGRTVITYNAEFDCRLMAQTAEKHGLELPDFKAECAMLIYGYWEGTASSRGDGFKWHKLQNACNHLNVQIEGTAHRALSDCKSTLGVLQNMIGQSIQPRKGF